MNIILCVIYTNEIFHIAHNHRSNPDKQIFFQSDGSCETIARCLAQIDSHLAENVLPKVLGCYDELENFYPAGQARTLSESIDTCKEDGTWDRVEIKKEELPQTLVRDDPVHEMPEELSFESEAEKYLLKLINTERLKWRYNILLEEPALTQASQEHSRNMKLTLTIWHTIGFSKYEFVRKYGSWGENVALVPKTTPIGVANQVHSNLMNSPGHRANILGAYSLAGVGIECGGENCYITEQFAG